MPLLEIPQPYDFELSTERYRAFGPDLANLWQDGGLHRVVDRTEVRIQAADGGVRVEPLTTDTKPVVRKLLGLEFDLDPFAAFGIRAGDAYAFPTRERLALAEPDELVALGFSRRKAEYVTGLARSDLDLSALQLLSDDEVKAQLVAPRGLGEWTADWFLARHLARPRAWPAGDLGLRKAVATFYLDGRGASTAEVRAVGERFDPFQ